MSSLNFMKLCMFNILMYEYVHTKFQLWYRPFLYTSLNLVKNESKSKNWKYDYGLFFIALPCLIVLILTYQMSQHIIKALQPRGCSFAERYMHLFDHFCRFFTQWKKWCDSWRHQKPARVLQMVFIKQIWSKFDVGN